MRSVHKFCLQILSVCKRIIRAFRILLWRPAFKDYGKDFRFDPDGLYSYDAISVGDNVNLGYRPIILASRSSIQIGNNVMFGPEVTIRGGNHRIDLVGRNMNSVRDDEKRSEDDLGVIIEDDVWVGTRAIILHGVTVGRGAVVAAGAVVSKSLPPYSIAVGVPARILRFRFDLPTILEHERILYPSEKRLKADELERIMIQFLPQNHSKG